MERKSPGWLSNELLRLDDHKRAVREESRACVHVWVWESANKGERLSQCVSLHAYMCACVRERQRRIQKEALPQVGPVNGLTSLRLKRTRHYKSRVAHKTVSNTRAAVTASSFQMRKWKSLLHLLLQTVSYAEPVISACLSSSGQRGEGRWNLLPQHARVWEGKKVISAKKGEWGTKTAQEFRGNLKSSVGEENEKNAGLKRREDGK